MGKENVKTSKNKQICYCLWGKFRGGCFCGERKCEKHPKTNNFVTVCGGNLGGGGGYFPP